MRVPSPQWPGDELVPQYQGPEAASAYRLVYAFTDHGVVRVCATPTLRRAEL
ncbi:hypothetical protein ACH4TV_13040 [Streptomyces sp. NPDC020898]|uniref:hypothetical protein n=1 Tax=Streptomyces sp. NPDC020898 TaxID=3365101 RepID=UPI00379A4EE7